ncbi:energy transducer TonB [Fibrella forsythiae]|uniref:Energy transducer TonB n=1 Tax=Fibrella forsythiae TaxID=2817061 RepID=A0ABS3JF33_9BACT|nr:energy transducer TonB [Fibrella forsythiae]MBO0948605.1 energy transducer TonB [Fibrella forsythiae]
MKLVVLFSLIIAGTVANAQTAIPALSDDPVFRIMLPRRIVYPAVAEHAGVYAKVYAGFRIDQRGHVQDVSILNPTKIGYGFEHEVIKKVKKLPPLDSKYEGSYALPVAFALPDYGNGAKVTSPSNTLPDMYLRNRILLAEIKIVGNVMPTEKGHELAPYTLGTVPLTNR